MSGRFLRLIYLVPADLEEALLASLWRAGTRGVEVEEEGDPVRLSAWFEANEGPELSPAQELAPPGVRLIAEERVADRDWLAPYRAAARPFALGRAFWVDPGEPAGPPPAAPVGRRLLRLPARCAFGTGSHASTRLALELLEEAEVAGRRVLDVGTGTGVLAFAALALGAREVVAFDLDEGAALAASSNAVLNREALGPGRLRLFAGEVTALVSAARFDLALANVIPAEIRPTLPILVALLAPGGELIFSGLLAAQEGEVLAELGGLGLEPRARRREGEWVAVRLAVRPRTPLGMVNVGERTARP